MGEYCQVYCPSGRCGLDEVARALEGVGLTVARREGHLVTGRPGSPEFRVWLDVGEHVREEAVEIGGGTPHDLRECDARFDIGFDDLEEVLDEINALMEIQGVIQDTCQGFLYLPWNDSLSEPWRESGST